MAIRTIKGRRGGFVAAFIAVLLGCAVITACGVLVDSGLRAGIAPERYAGAPVVVGASQELPVPEDIPAPFAERVPLPASDVDAVARVPGVRAAVGDVSVRVGVAGASVPVYAHGWSSAVLGPLPLVSGRAPRAADEVVVAGNLGVIGHEVDLDVGAVPGRYRVVGVVGRDLARESAVFLTDDAARRLSGRAGQVDAVGVLAAPDVDVDALAARISAAVPGVVTYTGNARADVEFLDIGQARSFLIALAGAFGGSMVLLVLLVVASTLGLTMTQRKREFALLRAIAATPRQIHRLIGAETLLVGVIGAVLGTIPGYLLSFGLRAAFAAVGAVPLDFAFVLDPLPGVVAVALVVGAARLAGYLAGRRAARISPVDALGEAAAEPKRLGRTRVLIGWALIPIAVGAAVVVPLTVPGQAALAGGASSALVLVVALALLGPKLVSLMARIFGLLSVSVGGYLAGANTLANARRLSAATTPLILGVTMAAVQIFSVTTTIAAGQHQADTGVVANYVLTGGADGLAPRIAADVAKVPGVTANAVARTTVLLSYLESKQLRADPFAAQGVTGDRLASVVNLDVRKGDIGALAGNTVALSTMAAGTAGVGIGGTVTMYLGDGTEIHPKVVAIYGNGLGFGDVTLPHDVVIAHTTNQVDTAVLISAKPGVTAATLRAALAGYPGVTVADRAAFTAAQNTSQSNQSSVNLILDAVILAYLAIAIANTLVASTAARGREFALLQLVGTTRRQVRAMMRGEARIVIALAIVFGSLAALPPLVGLSIGLTGSALPSVPLLAYLGIIGAATALAWCSITVATRSALRGKPIEEISASRA
ncbi:MAG TPA: FtsX-like permease family protein [Pseudonocardiaceae bacterium]|nr:FtsX-like permease family protein [Pseudonocardiaceae bacterium]